MNFTESADGAGVSVSAAAPSFQGFGLPGATVLLMAGGTTLVVGYALWEQLKFRMYKQGKQKALPGG